MKTKTNLTRLYDILAVLTAAAAAAAVPRLLSAIGLKALLFLPFIVLAVWRPAPAAFVFFISVPLLNKAGYYLGLGQVNAAAVFLFTAFPLIYFRCRISGGLKEQIPASPLHFCVLGFFAYAVIHTAFYLAGFMTTEAAHPNAVLTYWQNILVRFSQMDKLYPLKAVFDLSCGVLAFTLSGILSHNGCTKRAINRGHLMVLGAVNTLVMLQIFKQARAGTLMQLLRFQASGTFPDCNSLAPYLLLAMPVNFFFWKDEDRRLRFFSRINLGLTIAAVILSGSRTAAYLIILLFLGYGAYAVWRSQNRRLRLFLAAAGLLGGLAVTVTTFYATRNNYAASQKYHKLPPLILKTLILLNFRNRLYDKIGARYEYWRAAGYMMRERPLFGHGWGTFLRRVSLYRHLAAENKAEGGVYGDRPNDNAHNYFLQLWAETGVIGLFFFLMAVFLFFRAAMRAHAPPGENRVVLAAVSVYLIMLFMGHHLLILEHIIIFWAYLAYRVSDPVDPGRSTPREPGTC